MRMSLNSERNLKDLNTSGKTQREPAATPFSQLYRELKQHMFLTPTIINAFINNAQRW